MTFKIFWATELQAGYKKTGEIDLPIISQKIGYIHIQVAYLPFWIKRVAWAIK
jgi:hypothetical protein